MIVLTRNEMVAQRSGERHWLYTVTNVTRKPKLHIMQGPASKLPAGEAREICRYILRDWGQAVT